MREKLPNRAETNQLIDLALQEDLQSRGDVTSQFLLHAGTEGEAVMIAKEEGRVAGLPVAEQVFRKIDSEISFQTNIEDGRKVKQAEQVAQIRGKVASILTAERTALNFLQRLSGIATLTAQFVEQTKGTHAKILDTRKTTPAWRHLEKYAVRMGGGYNHRMGLYDMILIKENHIAAAGGITVAIRQARESLARESLDLAIEVEVTNLEQLGEALHGDVSRIMLDNMTLAEMRQAVQLVDGKVELEASGGVSLDTVGEIAATGVDYISVGALTHSAKALDLSLILK